MAGRPPADDIDRMERALGWRPTRFRPAAEARGAGGTAARWIVSAGPTLGGRSAFVKIGATPLTADWTRTEARTYAALRGWFLPAVLGFDDDGVRPALALEDLSAATWPPPWTDAGVEAVLEALAAIHATPPPPHIVDPIDPGWTDWQTLAEDPGPFLRLGLCSARWLDAAVPVLAAAVAAAPLAGTAVAHMDIRSDNLCLRSGRAVILDWNHALLANPELDVAFWLPSLHAEGGPPPESILPRADPGMVAWVAGFFCTRAGQAPIPEAPHVRPLQIAQSRTALPWAARALGLPEPV